jgi:uncharacterized protein
MHIRHTTATTDRPRLLITGASTRAAAWSAVRAGFFPVCADRFADEDLRQVAEVHNYVKVERERRTGHPTFVTSARLNVTEGVFDADEQFYRRDEHPQLRRLLGPMLGRNQFWRAEHRGVAKTLQDAGLPFLAENDGTSLSLSGIIGSSYVWSAPSSDGTWIEKPIWSGGGRGIRVWDRAAACGEPFYEPSYFQEYRAGQSMSAIFIADKKLSPKVDIVGLTEQLIGDEIAAAPSRFTYCGNIAPVALTEDAVHMLQRIGEVFAKKLGQRGIFGVDFIWDGTTPWVVEVNPRYTASCELLELALGRALLRDHWQAWLPNEPLPPLPGTPRSRPGVIGKLILYARTAVTAPDLSRFLRPRSPWTVPFLADIPHKRTTFAPGDPMCTVFATAATSDECRRKLYRRAERVRRWFGDAPGFIAGSS